MTQKIFLVLLTMFLPCNATGPVGTKIVKTFDAVPVSVDYQISFPHSLAIGNDGKIYLADGVSRVVFCWREDGTFAHTLGGPGDGPGEFRFVSGGGRALVSCGPDHVYVYDGANNRFSVFSQNSDLIQTFDGPDVLRGREVHELEVTRDGDFLFLTRQIGRVNFLETLLTTNEAQLISLEKISDESFTMTRTENGPNLKLEGYAHGLLMAYDPFENVAISGKNARPELDVISLPDGDTKTINLSIPRRIVSDTDKDAFMDQSFIKQRNIEVTFPEYKPYYDDIYPLSGGLVFISCSEGGEQRIVSGIISNRSGETTHTVRFPLQDEDRLFYSSGRFFLLTVNEQGDYLIQEIKLET